MLTVKFIDFIVIILSIIDTIEVTSDTYIKLPFNVFIRYKIGRAFNAFNAYIIQCSSINLCNMFKDNEVQVYIT